MTHRPAAGRKQFTVEQANAALPLVRAIVEDVVALSHEIVERRERLALLRGNRSTDARDPYSEELRQVDRDLERDRTRLYEYAGELRDLGVELKDAVAGLVDFPSLVDGRAAYLCWKLGEPEVGHWHEIDAGFSGRRAIAICAIGDSAD